VVRLHPSTAVPLIILGIIGILAGGWILAAAYFTGMSTDLFWRGLTALAIGTLALIFGRRSRRAS